MKYYYILLIFTALMLRWAQRYDLDRRPNELSIGRVKHSQATLIIFIIVAFALIFMSAMRYGVGADFWSYYGGYSKYTSYFLDSLVHLDEPGIKLIYIIAEFVSGDSQAPIALCAIITLGLILIVLYRNTDRLFQATMLFLFLGVWSHSFNAIRQFLAVAIVFTGFRFIRERKFWRYALLVFIAFLFHKTAMLMIIPYFIVHNKISQRNIALLIVGTVVVLLTYDMLFDIAGDITGSTHLDSEYAQRSVNILRIAVSVAPAIFAIVINYHKEKDESTTFYMNLLIIHATIMVMASGSTYFGRIGSYTLPFLCIAMPEIFKKIPKKNKFIIMVAIYALYLVYFLYDTKTACGNFYWIFIR